MPPQVLNANDPAQVFSPQVLQASLGAAGELLIFTGIAVPRWNSDGETNRETVVVKLGRTVIQQPADGAWSATVGLASINNTDSDFTFATDSVSIDLDGSGQLQLSVEIAVQGDTSALSSFSYQANVLVQEKPVGLVSVLVSNNSGIVPPIGPPTPVFQFGPQATVLSGSGESSRWRVRIMLDGPAPSPGVFVHLTSSNPAVAAVPQDDVPILAGHAVSADLIAPRAVNNSPDAIDVTITATLGSVSRTAVVTVLHPPS